MISEQLLREMVRRIHAFPDLNGCRVGLYGNYQCRVLHPGYNVGPNSERIIVIIEEVESDDPTVLRDLRQWAAAHGGSPAGAPNPLVVANRSRLGPELAGAGISCLLTAVAFFGVAGGVAAEVPTGGATTFLVVAAWTGFVTQSIQCANGLARIMEIQFSPESDTLEQWDQHNFYKYFMLILDGAGVTASVASLPFAMRNLWAVLSRQRSFAARGLSLERLKTMNQTQRLHAIQEVVEEASRTPEGRDALIRVARESGVGAKSIQSTVGLSVRNADRMVTVVRDETIRRLKGSLAEIGGSLIGFGASGMPSRLVGSASGSVSWIINVLDVQTGARTVEI